MRGKLYIVSAPIGNLEDITLRALRILKEVDLIAAEDTRHAKKLLNHYDIHTPMISYFEHNEIRRSEMLVEKINNGEDVALISNAGTPAISDPGYRVIRKCIDDQINLVPIPGPSALLAAVTVSGFPIHNFTFEGFLSTKSSRRLRRLREIAGEERTLIFYESPYRILKFLADVLEAFGDRELVIAREITKMYEEIYRGTVSQAIEKFTREKPRGEFTIVIRGHQDEDS
ncbi:16S rRNA (cytidine(1402)-2'-O)-methyltransferase [Candidatus Poribacteria bacterium]|nr:16S rRNA (cytidine(1402)-2'-O)-methyltransferase [Candidatus Poribacteria bacterium]